MDAGHFPSISYRDRFNPRFYHQLANYVCFHKLVRMLRLAVTNAGEVPATDVRIEISIANGQRFGIVDRSDVPKRPKRRESFLLGSAIEDLELRPALRNAGGVDIDRNDHHTKIEIECGSLQPGRKVWTDTFFMGIGRSGEINMTGYLFAANLPRPKEFLLSINATITETVMTVDDLLSLDEPSEEDDRDND